MILYLYPLTSGNLDNMSMWQLHELLWMNTDELTQTHAVSYVLDPL